MQSAEIGIELFLQVLHNLSTEEWKGLRLVSWAFPLTLPFTLASRPRTEPEPFLVRFINVTMQFLERGGM